MTKYLSFLLSGCVLFLSGCLNPLPERKYPVPTPLPQMEHPGLEQQATIQINVQNFAFAPQHITISPGTTITWKNYDQTGHSVGMLEGPQDFGTIQIDKGETATFRFDKVGKYLYKCGIHNTHPHVFATIEVK